MSKLETLSIHILKLFILCFIPNIAYAEVKTRYA